MQKPQVRVTAAQPVSDVRIELDRDDGKHVVVKQGALARNQAVTLSIGDGAAGKASWKGTISAQVTGEDHRWSDALQFDTFVRPPLHVGYDAEHLDLDKHELQFTMSRAAGTAEITAIGEDGSELGKGTATYAKEKPSTWVAITWTQPATARVLMLKLHAESADGGASDVQLVPWSVSIDHEDVNFATDSAEIATSEDGKLASSVDEDPRHREAVREVREDEALRRRSHRYGRPEREEPEAVAGACARDRGVLSQAGHHAADRGRGVR